MRNIQFKCKICGKEFKSLKACATRTPKFCSSKCYGISIAEFKECAWCRKKYYNYKSKKYCSRKCSGFAKRGKRFSQDHREKLSLAKKGKPIKHFIENKEEITAKIIQKQKGVPRPKWSGKNHPNWQGGKTPKNLRIRNSIKFKEWRSEVFRRDRWVCQKCENKNGSKINAHHIKPFARYPELRFEIKNGITLCIECHKLEHKQ